MRDFFSRLPASLRCGLLVVIALVLAILFGTQTFAATPQLAI